MWSRYAFSAPEPQSCLEGVRSCPGTEVAARESSLHSPWRLPTRFCPEPKGKLPLLFALLTPLQQGWLCRMRISHRGRPCPGPGHLLEGFLHREHLRSALWPSTSKNPSLTAGAGSELSFSPYASMPSASDERPPFSDLWNGLLL